MENPPRYIAIGDIHGLLDRLEMLLPLLPAEGTLVFLGDYIDRGPDSCPVIERLLQLEQERDCVFLRGNHEEMALGALNGDEIAEINWLRNGGVQSLRSYSGPIPDAHRDFLARTRPFFATEDYIFVHAGLLPGEQPEETEKAEPRLLWWIRDEFLNSNYNWGRLVIHGHTPTFTDHPEVLSNRINIDTGAVYGGPLTALVLPEMQFISVK